MPFSPVLELHIHFFAAADQLVFLDYLRMLDDCFHHLEQIDGLKRNKQLFSLLGSFRPLLVLNWVPLTDGEELFSLDLEHLEGLLLVWVVHVTELSGLSRDDADVTEAGTFL